MKPHWKGSKQFASFESLAKWNLLNIKCTVPLITTWLRRPSFPCPLQGLSISMRVPGMDWGGWACFHKFRRLVQCALHKVALYRCLDTTTGTECCSQDINWSGPQGPYQVVHLHGLSICFWALFNVLILTLKTLNGLWLVYLKSTPKWTCPSTIVTFGGPEARRVGTWEQVFSVAVLEL